MNNTTKRPREAADWDQHYVEGQLPWDTGKPDIHLPGVISNHSIAPGKALEIGCGTGTNAIWLTQQGFEVTGFDLSPTAIQKAKAKIADAKIKCELFVGDFLNDKIPNAPYRFVYDRGVFHVFDAAEQRANFAARVAHLLEEQGVWHSLLGSTDGPPRDFGPPRRSAADIAAAVEPHFEILELKSVSFDDEQHEDARAWILVARRRGR